jgi:hypothetical protein
VSEAKANVLVNFRLDPATPIRVAWMAADGTPTDGYKPQITAIVLANGARLAMDASAILEHATAGAGAGEFAISFTGMVGFAADHADRARVEGIAAEEAVDYEIAFVRAEDGKLAALGTDYTVTARPQATARKLPS